MSRPAHKARLLLAAIAILGSKAAGAWTPYGYGPYGTSQPPPMPPSDTRAPADQRSDADAPPRVAYPRYGAAPEFPLPGGPSFGPEGYGPRWPAYPPTGPGPGFPGVDGSGRRGPSTPLQISRHATADAYVIDVRLDDMHADDIQISTRGNWIRVSRDQSRQEVREDSFEQGGGYSRSYSFSSANASRRFNVPGDADLDALTREEKDGVLRILIPRRRQQTPPRP